MAGVPSLVNEDDATEVVSQVGTATGRLLEVVETIRSLFAGERRTASALQSWQAVLPECKGAVISKTTAVTIGGGQADDTVLVCVVILAALTGTCVITGLVDSDGAAQTITIPVASVGTKEFYGMINSAGALTVTCSNAADDNLVIIGYRDR